MSKDIFKSITTDEPIAAISTPRGRGAIGIVRISGPGCREIAGKVFRSDVRPEEMQPHRLTLGTVVDPETMETIDQVLLAVMKAPESYTGQDMVEIYAHGGMLILDRILDVLVSAGCRLARPGEFTQRAFLNDKLTLTQAEAVADLIDAKTETAHRLALQALAGQSGEAMARLREKLSDLLIRLEANIDFPPEDVGGQSPSQLANMLKQVQADLDEILRQARQRIHHLEGLRTPICGKRNVGKSSLLNRLLGQERALVTSIPGTTRDTIEEDAILDGELLHLVDTAGVGDSVDPVEVLGLQRTSEAIEESELVLFVVDLSGSLDDDDRKVHQLLRKHLGDGCFQRVLLIGNKLDKNSNGWSPEEQFPGLESIKVSALTGEGIDELVKKISAIAKKEEGEIDNPGVHIRTRQIHLISAAMENVQKALENLFCPIDRSELAVEDIRAALENLEDFDGVRVSPDVLEAIFSRFCIGK